MSDERGDATPGERTDSATSERGSSVASERGNRPASERDGTSTAGEHDASSTSERDDLATDGSGADPGAGDDPRNVVVVTVDSLRADHCGFVGYPDATTPTLDAMAEDGLAFEHAISPGPSTYDSMPAIFTGRHMARLATDGDGDALDRRGGNIGLNMQTSTIPEWFDRQGYATAAFTTNPYTGEHTEFGRGFDHFEDFMDGGEGAIMRKAAHVPVLSEVKHVVTLVRGDRASKNWTEYVDDVLEWVEDAPEPFFLWLFLLDTHTPYLPPAEYRDSSGPLGTYYHNWRLWTAKKWLDSDGATLDRDSLVGLYDDSIRSVDAFLDRLRSELAERDPAIVVHADHGEAFGEHGSFGHEATLYEENVHVPLVVDGVEESASPSTPVSLTELPTLLRSLARGDDRPSDAVADDAPAVASSWEGGTVAVRGEDWKYVADVDLDADESVGDGSSDAARSPMSDAAGVRAADSTIVSEAVYDLESDPGERRDVSDQHPDLVEACRDRVALHRSHLTEVGAVSRAAEAIAGGDEASGNAEESEDATAAAAVAGDGAAVDDGPSADGSSTSRDGSSDGSSATPTDHSGGGRAAADDTGVTEDL